MGQKTHPYGFRLGYNKAWKSRWYADRDYANLLHEDVVLRKQLKDRLKAAGISSIEIERAAGLAGAPGGAPAPAAGGAAPPAAPKG